VTAKAFRLRRGTLTTEPCTRSGKALCSAYPWKARIAFMAAEQAGGIESAPVPRQPLRNPGPVGTHVVGRELGNVRHRGVLPSST
jgi:hypothetical protein